MLGKAAEEPLLPAIVEEIIPKNNLERLAEWKDMKGKWTIDAYVLEIVSKSDDPDGEFINWLEAKYPQFFITLKKDAKDMNLKISYPPYEVMEYIKKPDGSFNKFDFHKAYHNLLKLADINDDKIANDIKWRMFMIFGIPPEMREMPLGYIYKI